MELIERIREDLAKECGWTQIELKEVERIGDRILFRGVHSEGGFTGEADENGKIIGLTSYRQPNEKERVKRILESAGYEFKSPTLVLEGRDGWFVILTPSHPPYHALVHWDGTVDFLSTIPKKLE